MTRIDDVAKILYGFYRAETLADGLECARWEEMPDSQKEPWQSAARALDSDGHLLPDLPEPDTAYPEWQIENMSISPGIDPGEVAIVWEGREDTGRGTMPRSRYLSPAQVQAIIAAHYHREDQE